jgi:outer membrane protein TolC
MSRLTVISIVFAAVCLSFAAGDTTSDSSSAGTMTKEDSIKVFTELYNLALNNSFAYQTALSVLKDAGTDIAIRNWDWAPNVGADYEHDWTWLTNKFADASGQVSYQDLMDRQFTSLFRVEETVFSGLSRINEKKAAVASREVADRAYKASREDVLLALIQLVINLNSSYGEMDYAYWSLYNSLGNPLPADYWTRGIGRTGFEEVDGLYNQAMGFLADYKGTPVSVSDPKFNELKQVADDSHRLLAARNTAEADKIQLLRFIGQPPGEDLDIRLNPDSQPAFAEPDEQYSFATAQENNYDLQRAKMELAVAEARRGTLINGYLPTVSTSLLYGFYQVPLPLEDDMDKLDLASVGVKFSWDIDSLFTTPLQYDKAGRTVELARKNIKQIEDDLRAQIEILREAYKYSYSRWMLSGITVQLKLAYLQNRLESFRNAKDKAGAISDLEQARNEHYYAVRDRILLKSMVLSSWAQLLQAVGKLTVENFYELIAE